MLEPIVDLEVTVPENYMGDVLGDLNTRRARIQGMEADGPFQKMLLKPKTHGVTRSSNNNPIVAVLKIDHIENIEDPKLTVKNFKFMEWGVIRPKKEQPLPAASANG